MDTLFDMPEFRRLVNFALSAAIIGVFVFAQSLFFNSPIFADDMQVAHAPVPALGIDTEQLKEHFLNEYSMETRAKNFDEDIKKKYPNSLISTVADGVKHIKLTKYYSGRPVRINVVEMDLKLAGDFELKPALSSSSNNLKSRRTITTIAKNTNSIVALNGTYFKPQNGVPLGTLMIDEKMYTGPVYDRVALGIFSDGGKTRFDLARVQLNASVEGSGNVVKVNNINQPRMLSTHVIVYTPEWGKTSPYAPKYGMGLRVENGVITKASANPIAIPSNGYVISGPKSLLQPLLKDKNIKLDISTTPDWKGVTHIISGGPYLVKNGEVFVDMTAQKLSSIGGRNPRSAIGYTEDNRLILVAVDGREGRSIGMTLMELANFMKSAGCAGAINLDGGGSTVMYVNGKVVNKPQVYGGIPISNAVVISKKIN